MKTIEKLNLIQKIDYKKVELLMTNSSKCEQVSGILAITFDGSRLVISSAYDYKSILLSDIDNIKQTQSGLDFCYGAAKCKLIIVNN
jgi:hypothetical protein